MEILVVGWIVQKIAKLDKIQQDTHMQQMSTGIAMYNNVKITTKNKKEVRKSTTTS